jgi:hypothetical protein
VATWSLETSPRASSRQRTENLYLGFWRSVADYRRMM